MPAQNIVNRIALLVLSTALLSACGGSQARMARHMDKGRQFLADHNYEKARIEFQNALQIAPTDAEARFENGVVDEQLGKVRDAAQFYLSTIDVNPDHVKARTNLARLYLFSGAPDKALETIAPAFEKHPDDAELLTVRAAVRQQQKDPTGALSDGERAVQLAPTSENAVAVLAGLYSAAGDMDKARILLERSIQSIPDTVDLRLALAQVYAQQNHTAESEALFLKIIQMRPNEKAHRLRLAQYYARLQQPDAAERTLREAVKALPSDHEIKMALIEFLAAQRGRDAAQQELKRMISADPNDAQMQFALARFYESGDQAAEAAKVYQNVIDAHKLDSDGLAARDRLAALRVRGGDTAGALALAQQVLDKSPRDDDALLLRGEIALTKQDPRSAIADLRAVLRDQPNAVGVLRTLARAHLVNGEPAVAEETMRHALEANPGDAALQLDFAQLLLTLNKPEQAKPMLANILQKRPNDLPALEAQFRVSMGTGDLAAAQAAAANIVAAQPKAAAGYFFEGMVAEAQKHDDDAVKLYGRAVDAEPNSLEPMQAQIRLLVSVKRVDEAYRRADDVAKRYPESALGPEAKGELLLSNGRNSEAQNSFQDAIARAPNWWPPYGGLAAAKMADKDAESAIDVLKKADGVVKAPEHLEIELAGMLEMRGKPDEAVSVYEKALKRNPQSDVAFNNLAMLLVNRKDQESLDRAKTLTARFAQSANVSFMDTYGWVLYKHGEAAASLPVLQKVVEKAPNEPVVLYHLGMAQSQLGSSTEARRNLQRAVQSGAKFPGLDEARATLDKIANVPQPVAAAPTT
jgi:tetratricopeptide (TPR) repeat protein